MNHENYHSETYQNIGKSLYVFNELEFFINCIIAHYIKPSDREFVIEFFLNTSVTSFGTKIKMLGTFEKFTNKELDIFRKYANFRNVFAHSNRTHFFDAVSYTHLDVYKRQILKKPTEKNLQKLKIQK